MKRQQLWRPDRRDIIWIDFNPHVGTEMKNLHPMLVLSPRAFNEKTGIRTSMRKAEQHHSASISLR